MATERGGLEYTLRIRDQGLSKLKAFRSEVERLKADLSGLSARRGQSGLGRLGNDARTASRGFDRLAAAQRRLRPVQLVQANSLGRLRQARQGFAQARVQASRLGSAVQRASAQTNSLGAAAQRASSSFGLIGQGLGFAAIFRGIQAGEQALSGLVRGVVDFNAQTETARLGIASLVTAFLEVRDANGQVLQGVEALNAAQKLSTDQINQLRVDSLQTAGTFEELQSAFQTAVGSGLEAGLDLDQVREFTVQISQAASALGVEQFQLPEEIRSLLSGRITANTRIATVLGITNEEVKRARELGNLAEFLAERFEPFRVAGKQSLGSFAALSTNLQGAVQLALGTGGEVFFENVKQALQDGLNAVLVQGDGALTIQPQVIEAVSAVAEGLSTAFVEARRLAELFGSDLVGGAELFGSTISVSIQFLSGFVEGLVVALQASLGLARGVESAFRSLTGIDLFDETSVQGFGRSLALVLAALGGIKLALTAVNVASAAYGRTLVALRVAGFAAFKAGPILAVVAAVATLGRVAKESLDQFAGADTGLLTFARLIDAQVGGALKGLALQAELVFTQVLNTVRRQGTAIAGALVDLFSTALDTIGTLILEGFGDTLATAIKVAVEQAVAPFRTVLQGLAFLGSEDAQAALDALDDLGDTASSKIKEAAQEFLEGSKAITAAAGAEIARVEADLALNELLSESGIRARIRANEVDTLRGEQGALAAARSGEDQGITQNDVNLLLEGITDPIDPVAKQLEKTAEALSQSPVLRELADQGQGLLGDLAGAFEGPVDAQQESAENLVQATEELAAQFTRRPVEPTTTPLLGGSAATTEPTGLGRAFVELRDTFSSIGDGLRRFGSAVTNVFSDTPSEEREFFQQGQPSVFSIGPQAQGVAEVSEVNDQEAERAERQETTLTRLGQAINGLTGSIQPLSPAITGLKTELSKLSQAVLTLASTRTQTTGTGRAMGGIIPGGPTGSPPPGVSSADSVPIWAQPGEFMQRLSAVRRYGLPFMEALNRGLVDPTATQALMGIGRRRQAVQRLRPTGGRGYQTGGQVNGSAGSREFMRALLVNDESFAEAVLDSPAFVRAIHNNQETIRSVL